MHLNEGGHHGSNIIIPGIFTLSKNIFEFFLWNVSQGHQEIQSYRPNSHLTVKFFSIYSSIYIGLILNDFCQFQKLKSTLKRYFAISKDSQGNMSMKDSPSVISTYILTNCIIRISIQPTNRITSKECILLNVEVIICLLKISHITL